MLRITALLVVAIFTCSLVQAQALSTRDSVQTFYDSLFSLMRTKYLYRDSVDWNRVEADVRSQLDTAATFEASLGALTSYFDAAKADHCTVYYNDESYAATGPDLSSDDFSEQWMAKYSTEPAFEAKVIGGGEIGYILLPGMMYEDTSAANVSALAQLMYDQIAALKQRPEIKRWIIDLRFNPGGNIPPMLLALYDFLGDTDVWGMLDLEGQRTATYRLYHGKYGDGSHVEGSITPFGKTLTTAPVTLLTSIITASSGEIVVLAFKGRPDVLVVGEPSMGRTTTNDLRSLPFGIDFVLTLAIDCDRNGKTYSRIEPDVLVKKGDNFDDLMLDEKVIASGRRS